MRSGGSGEKGGRWERDVCKALSRWLSGGKRDDLFWRTSMSGGRATIGQKRGQLRAMQAGDICAIDPLGYPFAERFVVECKHRAELDIEQFLLCGTGRLVKYWDKLVAESRSNDKLPMLIGKQNRMPPFVMVMSLGPIHLPDWNEPMLTTQDDVKFYLWSDFLDGSRFLDARTHRR